MSPFYVTDFEHAANMNSSRKWSKS